ncbi:hypothetical protein WJX84_011711 [Apatococcus fuscideae]|uniref:Twin-arginine translocation signal domain-containing protein n=1 Tax=Apatococcus fuscideae TaxID=2026836 RepID=A0AAW1SXW8_9CHLO
MLASSAPVKAPTCLPSVSSRQQSVVCKAAARPAAPQTERRSFLQKAAAAAAAGLLLAGPAMARPTDFLQTPPSANKPGEPATEDKLPTNPSNTGQPVRSCAFL